MLQRLLFITLTLCSLTATAQWQQTGSKVRYVNGLGIPTKDTAAGVAADSSQIVIRPQDSALYIKYKRTWVKVGSGGGGTIGGSGTTNYVPKFTAGTTLGNSQIFDDGTNVGVGTITPSAKLDVLGTFRTNGIGANVNPVSAGTNQNYLRFLSTGADFYVGTESSVAGAFFTGSLAYDNVLYGNSTAINLINNGVSRIYVASGGNIGMGYTAPAAKLAVSGTTLINTNTDNGVDKLQVSGSMNVSARATAQNLSVTNDITARTIFSGSDQAGSVDGLVITAGNEKGLVINNTNSTGVASQSRLSWKHNGADRGLFFYSEATQTFSFQSSGAARNIQIASEAGVGFYMTGANTNVRIGSNTAANAPLSVNGFALINTNTNNSVDALQVNGSIQANGFKQAYVAKTGAYTATTDDYFIDCTSGSFTVTLYAASGNAGRILIIKNSGAGTITIDGNASETIDGSTIKSLLVQYDAVQIMCDGTNWKIISNL